MAELVIVGEVVHVASFIIGALRGLCERMEILMRHAGSKPVQAHSGDVRLVRNYQGVNSSSTSGGLLRLDKAFRMGAIVTLF